MKYLTRAASTIGRTANPSGRQDRPESRANRPARYTFLEDSSMSRAMYRL
ncbi:hypothetical protein [Mycobacterium asiaticum]|nr:hypothetical protein [Mycobacterium asiaticum]